MNRLAPVALIVLLAAACSPIPRIAAPMLDSHDIQDIQHRCAAPFPREKLQFLHAIQARLPGGRTAVMMGLSQIDPASGRLHAVLMTVEGLVLFEAGYDGKNIRLDRSLAPFDRPGFAAGLMADIRRMFLQPAGDPSETGMLEDGASVCRYRRDDRTIDVIVFPDGGFQIEEYRKGRRFRSIHTGSVASKDSPSAGSEEVFPEHLRLQSHGRPGYVLDLSLLSVESLKNEVANEVM